MRAESEAGMSRFEGGACNERISLAGFNFETATRRTGREDAVLVMREWM